jgi:serine/threonine-protein kinase
MLNAETLAQPHTDLSLSATIAAPLFEVTLDAPDSAALNALVKTRSGLNTSVLPRLETTDKGVRLSTTIGPRYATVKELGRGGMGEVALVEDRDIGRPVAMKKLHASESGPASVARFVDEVRTIGSLEHPNIVPIHDVGVDDEGRFFFVMKYVDGETLESVIDRLQRGDPETLRKYDMPRRIEILLGILRALSFAHERGIIHRDIKPANVMIGKHGEIILMDWGVARTLARTEANQDVASLRDTASDIQRVSSTHAGVLIGTPLYMSPEQASGLNESLDARSDLYSLSVLFHEFITLKHRLSSETSLVGVLHRITTEDIDNLKLFTSARGVPPELIWFVLRGLERKPEDRWQTAAEMIEELHGIQSGKCRVQCSATFMKRMSTESSRAVDKAPLLVAVVASAFVTTFVGLSAHFVWSMMQ